LKAVSLSPLQVEEAVDVLCEAFFDYPVIRYVIGRAGDDYACRLRTLVDFFVMARFLRYDLVLGVRAEGGGLAAAATVTLPDGGDPPEELRRRRRAVWRRLGEGARRRYEALGEALREFGVDRPHYHLNMIGVRRAHTGRGLARCLLEAVHETSALDRASCGVTLNTEDPSNVPLYERFGYRVLGHARVTDDIETWCMFRDDDE
jgi:ribosomal protein S18 acetylase RimI-like enzyme